MNRERFISLVKELHAEELEINRAKGREYATDEDVLLDFRLTAQECEVPMRKVCYILMQKHWRAVAKYARDGELVSKEKLRDRTKDLNLYLKLLLAIQIEDEELREYYRESGVDPYLEDEKEWKVEASRELTEEERLSIIGNEFDWHGDPKLAPVGQPETKAGAE